MNENPDEKIEHARDLLKKFQSKQKKERGSLHGSMNNGSETNAAIFHLNSSTNTVQLDNSSSCNESICQEGASQISRETSRPPSIGQTNDLLTAQNTTNYDQLRCHSVPKNFSTENDGIFILKNSLAQKQQELNDALGKLQSLHKHYAELHTAYNQINNKNSVQNYGIPPEYADQIQQLRTTLAVTMDEKMALQSELRELKAKFESMSYANQQQTTTPATATNYELESRLNRLTGERDQLLETIKSLSTQIEKQRRESSGLEAKLVLIQQDRLDSQARLKVLYEEKNELERNSEKLRQDLGMRDIYLRQLTRHSIVEQQPEDEKTTDVSESISEAKNRLENDLTNHKMELSGLQKQLSAAKEHYQNALNQASAQIHVMSAELGELRAAKGELESTNEFLEEQLRVAKINIQTLSATKPDENKVAVVDYIEFVQLQQQIALVTGERENMLVKIEDMTKLMESKNEELESLKIELVEADRKIADLEQRQNIHSTIQTDVALLSSDLQNEKATVSRAVAQNMELKVQLSELQDRLVQIINESAIKEDERVTALATVERLKREINERVDMRREQETKNNEICIENRSTVKTISEPINIEEQIKTAKALTSENRFDEIPDSDRKRHFYTIGIQTEHKDSEEGHTSVQEEDSPKNQVVERVEPTVAADQKQEEMSSQLERRLEELSKENQQFRMDNEKLQYWLTTLETENESIGEYIALYRFQRGNIQKRIAEKDQQVQQLQQQNSALMAQFVELRNSMLAFLGQQQTNMSLSSQIYDQQHPPPKREHSESDDNISKEQHQMQEHNDQQESPRIAQEDRRKSQNDGENGQVDQGQEKQLPKQNSEMERLIQALDASQVFGNQATCSMAQDAQIHCTGCLECRGEMFTL